MNEDFRLEGDEENVRICAPSNLDANTVTRFRHVIDNISERRSLRTVIVDLDATRFMDSAGAGFLVGIMKAAGGHEATFSIENSSGQPSGLIKQLKIDLVASVS